MASSFMGLYVQREALVTAQKALDITGSNISNVKTVGYSRQRVDVCSVGNYGYNLFYNTSVSMAGQGVDAVGVTQLRDSLIDNKVRDYTSISCEYGVKGSVMSEVETVLDNIESEDAGLAVNLAKFKEALQSFSSDNADRQEIANVTMEAAKSVAQQINYLNERLNDVSEQTLGDAKGTVTDINSILTNMASLNEQITASYVSMGYISASTGNYIVDNDYGPLELKDEMNNLIDQLSQYGNVSVKEQNNGAFTVTFANQVVVHNDRYAQIAMTEEAPQPFDMAFKITDAGTLDKSIDRYPGLMDNDEWKEINYSHGSTENYVRQDTVAVDITGTDKITTGSLRAYLDTYNGDGNFAADGVNAYQGIEYYRDMLNSLAKTMTEEFNAVFEADYGFTLFNYKDDTGVENFHAAADNFKLSEEWINNPSLIAKPHEFNNISTGDLEELDNTYINKMLGVFDANYSYGYVDENGDTHNEPLKMSFEKFVANISDKLGAQVESNGKIMKTTDIMLESVMSARDEVMAVSVNEEGINMLNYQKWYNAIARMVTTLDQALDKIINGMGVVGL